ncbi:SHOCT domain-containing protein [Natrarchaeobius chitinivorans]|uniref:SHOCT domain-containing protein n=1 Tax=Natrarchaeobius chitinivorans TaxID=1679083 RepID=A0A3N6M246_NATCH|nr:SHOCT domain-containing protein [Natrarchaeobius chitinivorans]RQG94434.1 SHOCT domain-containing protein [Natrarchaeobius chitinivorans]
MGRFGTLLLKGVGVFLLGVLALAIVWTILSAVLSLVATVVSLLVTAVVVGVLVLAAIGLFSILRDRGDSETRTRSTSVGRSIGDDERQSTAADPESRLRSRYVAGELSDDEFERRLDRVLEDDETRDRSGGRYSNSRDLNRSRR